MGMFSACELAAAHLMAAPEHTADLITSADNYNSPLITGADTRELATTMARTLLEVVDKTLREASLDLSEITRVAFVNWSEERVRERAAVPLGLPMSRLTWEFGASDQVLSLDHLLVSGELNAGDNLLLLGTGTGANIACMAVRILHGPAGRKPRT